VCLYLNIKNNKEVAADVEELEFKPRSLEGEENLSADDPAEEDN